MDISGCGVGPEVRLVDISGSGVGPEVRRVDISGCDVGPEVRRVDISGGGPSSLGPCMVKFVSLEALPEGRTFFSLI